MTDSSHKPIHSPGTSQSALRALFDQHNFAELLPKCERIEIVPKCRRKAEDTFHSEMAEYEEGIKYRDPETKQTVAVIFFFTDIGGRTFQTIRSLRVGTIVYDAATRPN
jgi:hypothetical protein